MKQKHAEGWKRIRDLGPRMVAIWQSAGERLWIFGSPLVLLLVGAVIVIYTAFVSQGPWDSRAMFASGWFWVTLGLFLSTSVSSRLEQALSRLEERDVLSNKPQTFSKDLKQRSAVFAPFVGTLTATIVATLWVLVDLPLRGVSGIGFLVGIWVTGFIVGFILTRLVAFGVFIGPAISQSSTFVLELKPGHPDGAAGLKPLGDFYLYQAFLTAIPCLHLGLWITLISLGVSTNLDHWFEPYLLLLGIAIAFEASAACIPLWVLHKEMLRLKRRMLGKADQMSREIIDLRERLAAGNLDRDETLRVIASKEEWYRTVEHMPTWPLDLSDWRKFTIGNLALVAPLFLELGTQLGKDHLGLA